MRKLTDEQLDKVMSAIADSSSLDDSAIREISSSPQLWWAVKRNIAVEKETAKSPWPPANVLFRWLAIGAPAVAAIAFAFIYFGGRSEQPMRATLDSRTRLEATVPQNITTVDPVSETSVPPANPIAEPGVVKRSQPRRSITQKRQSGNRNVRTAPQVRSEEISSEFIALAYSANPESGQLVRVKVPSSMMVNLGLVDSVERPSRLVDAEIVVGDDGQTHAIRFIRQ